MKNYETLIAYLPGLVNSNCFPIADLSGSERTIKPDHSVLRSVPPQLGHIRPLAIVLHFLQASSLTILITRFFSWLLGF